MKQKGFTLVEVLVVLAVGGVLMTGLLLSIHNVVFGTGRTNSQVVALMEVNNTALRLKKDIQMAHTVVLLSPPSLVELGWTDYTGAQTENLTHSITYELSGTKLLRTYDSGNTSIVGRNIASVVFTEDGRVVNVVITATGSGFWQRSETLEFSVYRRSEGL